MWKNKKNEDEKNKNIYKWNGNMGNNLFSVLKTVTYSELGFETHLLTPSNTREREEWMKMNVNQREREEERDRRRLREGGRERENL